MASNLPIIIFLVLVSLALISGYSTTSDVSKHEDETYVMPTNDYGSVSTVVEDVVKASGPQALDGSKVVENAAVFKSSSSKSKKGSKKKHKSKKIGSLDVNIFVDIIVVIVVLLVIICVSVGIYYYYLRPKNKEAQSI
ncbi:PREDICTED: uncharacterized protein LOC104786836 [Camelina sativa]|uniref:Uncharacterized protein LOC104786836 n=1 Tax=Camelina sativa TaxID=90675 RepID=A0ABM1RP93_CAMSA|nr:PREDICTED: uncharacterized protein LOC104786836 [Camelina sativa]